MSDSVAKLRGDKDSREITNKISNREATTWDENLQNLFCRDQDQKNHDDFNRSLFQR
ncbi:hypothetical protein N9291_00195 [bacterium]|nr:hypothetical protein [bacterium]